MAGKKMRGRKTNSHNTKRARYKNAGHTVKNKEARKAKHQALVEKGKETSEARLKLLNEACALLKVNTYQLKRLIGTPNIRRLTDVINGTYQSSQWFVLREAKKKEREENAKQSIRKPRYTSNKKIGKKKRQNSGVSKGSDTGDKKA